MMDFDDFFTQNVTQQGKQLLLLNLFRNSFRKTTNNVKSVTILDLRFNVTPLHTSYSKICGCHRA
jgi:hypothetical protein